MYEELYDLSGRTAIVTGGARGLGRASAVGLAAFGADLALIDLEASACESTAAEITALGPACRAYGCDVSDQPAVRETVEYGLHPFPDRGRRLGRAPVHNG